MEAEAFVHDENITLYRKLIEISKADPFRDEERYQMLRRLLAEEKAKQEKPRDK